VKEKVRFNPVEIETTRQHERYMRVLCPLLPDSTPEFIIALGRIIDRHHGYRVRHINNPKAISIHSNELIALLGRNWKKVCEGIIWTEGKRRFTKGSRRREDNYTMEFHVNPDIAKALGERHSRDSNVVNELVRSDGVKIKHKNAMRHAQRKSTPNLPALIHIDVQAVEEQETVYSDWLDAIDAETMPKLGIEDYIKLYERKRNSPLHTKRSFDEFASVWRQIVVYRFHRTNTVLELADAAGGKLPQRYEQRNGKPRYQGIGAGSLQSCNKELRYAALRGQHEYDIKACHHYIILNFAEQAGIHCPQLIEMVSDKKKYRQEISRETGNIFNQDDVKKALLMICYGARFHSPITSDEDATGLLEAFGENGQEALRQSASFMLLRKELNKVFDYIIESHKAKHGSRGGIKNAVGQYLRPKDGERLKRSSILAFILQGIEVQAMLAMLSVCKSAQVTIHDGIVCRERENKSALEDAMFKATGIRFELDYKQIKGPIW
jgi:hypothetical protein